MVFLLCINTNRTTDLTLTESVTCALVIETSVKTNNSPSQDCTSPDDRPTTNVSHNQQQSLSGLHQLVRSTNHKRQSQPTTVPLRTTPTRTIDQPQTSVITNNSPSQDCTSPDDRPNTNISHNQQQSFSGLHQLVRSTNHKRQSQPTTVPLRTTPTRTIDQPQTSVITNNSPSQDCTNPDDRPTTNVSHNQQQYSPSQDYTNSDDRPTTNVSHNQQQYSPSQDYTSPDDRPTTNVSHNQQQSFSGLHQPGRSTNHKRQSQPTIVLLRTTPTRTIDQPQTSVITNNSPSQDCTSSNDRPTTNVSHNQQQSF